LDRTVRLRLRLHQRPNAARAARKARQPRVMPAMAPPERGEVLVFVVVVVVVVVGKEEDRVRDKVALT
jgi:hypothetical protein